MPRQASFDLHQADLEARHRALARVADTMAYPPPDLYSYFLDELYALLANGFDDLSVRVLEELMEREGRYGVEAAAYLLRQSPNQIVFERVEFVEQLLIVAGQAEHEIFAFVQHSLFNIALNPPPFVPGEPARWSTEQARNRAAAAAMDQPEGSLIRAFFDDLVRAAEARIEFERSLRPGMAA